MPVRASTAKSTAAGRVTEFSVAAGVSWGAHAQWGIVADPVQSLPRRGPEWLTRGSRRASMSPVVGEVTCLPLYSLAVRSRARQSTDTLMRKTHSSRRSAALLLIVIGFTQALSAQQPPELLLRVRETVPISAEDAVAIMHPIKCDSRGNLYVRYTDPVGRHLASPVMRISREGKRTAEFRLEAAPGFENAGTFDDFAVDLRGKVYLVANRVIREQPLKVEQVIVGYESDGDHDSTIKLEAFFQPAQLAVFLSGEFLASGEKLTETNADIQAGGKPFTGIFDRHGALVAEVTLPDDVEAEQGAEPKLGETPQRLPVAEFRRALSEGNAVAAEDGNIYLMRATSKPLIYVVSPRGDVVRRLVITPPAEHARAITMQAAAGKVVVMFVERHASGRFKRHVFAVADWHTGETIAHYVDTPEIGGALACYTPNGFTFLGSKDDQWVIRTTHPQ